MSKRFGIGLLCIITGVLCASLISSVSANAAGGPKVMKTFTSEDNVTVYVSGTDVEEDVQAQVGTSEAAILEKGAISDLAVPMRTLVMVDNSISIKEADRAKISDLLQNVISDRISGEEIAISIFSEGTTYLCDYTSDYGTLKSAIDSIEYKDQETYLTDVLYDLLNAQDTSEDIYSRIIIISDGVDNKSLGVTREELNSLLKENNIPIYTFGSVNKKKSNNDMLESMFALSRQTGGESFLLDDYDNILDVMSVLDNDRMVIRYVIEPDGSQMDGTVKSVKITTGSGSFSSDCRMPQKIAPKEEVKEEPTKEVKEPEPESIEEEEEEPEEELIFGLEKKTFYAIVIGAASVLSAVIIAVVILIILKARKKKEAFKPIDDELLNELNKTTSPDEKTEYIGREHGEDSGTQMLWGQKQSYQVILTDVNSPMKTFQVPISKSIVIGRKKESCDVTIDYDRSVSSRHCEINVRDGHFYIKDLQSSNKTYVNGSEVLTEVELFTGNKIKMGRVEMKFEIR